MLLGAVSAPLRVRPSLLAPALPLPVSLAKATLGAAGPVVSRV